MFFSEICLLIEELVNNSEKRKIAKTILDTQDIKEESWDSKTSKYTKTNFMSAIQSCQKNELDNFWIYIIERLNKHAWNNSQDWATAIINNKT